MVQLNNLEGLIINSIKLRKCEFSVDEKEFDKNSKFLKNTIEETIDACIPLVKYIVNKYFSRYKSTNIIEDVYQSGNVGVCKAYYGYRNDGRCTFKTFACACIKHEIQNFIDSYIGRKGLSKYELNNGALTSLDKARGNENEEVNLYNSVVSEMSDNYKDVENRLTINKIITNLKVNERIIIEGLLEGKNQSQIAREMNLSSERVSKIKQRAFSKMRCLLEK